MKKTGIIHGIVNKLSLRGVFDEAIPVVRLLRSARNDEKIYAVMYLMISSLMILALVFTFASCSKKKEAPQGAAKKEAPAMTPEQAKRIEEIKKGAKESKNVVAAKVNGVDITMFSLIKEMNAIAPNIVPAEKTANPQLTEKVKKKALDNLIFRELALQEAVRQGIKIDPRTVDDVVSKVKAGMGSEEAYKKYLEERNLTEAELRKLIERDHLLQRITAKEIYDKITVNEKTLREAYEKDKAIFMTKDNPPRQLSFEEVKVFIARKIKSEQSEKPIENWKRELKKNAKIEIMPATKT